MSRRVQVIGVPYGHGGGGAGCELGPAAVRQAGLADHVGPEGGGRYVDGYDDAGDLALHTAGDVDRYDFDGLVPGKPEADVVDADRGYAKNIDQAVRMWDAVADAVADSIDAGNVPLVVGGDHTVATGTMRGASRDGEIGVLWLDAHADYNTPLSSPSGNVHGMPLAAALGRGPFGGREWAEADVREGSVALVGLRALDHDLPGWVAASEAVDGGDTAPEAAAIADSEVTATTMADVDEHGLETVLDVAIDAATDGVDGVHVSVDLDWLDPGEVSGVGTPVAGGVTRREARRAMAVIAERNRTEDFVRSIEFVEVNPLIDEAGNGTGEVAAELAGAAFGEQFVYDRTDVEERLAGW